MLVLSMRTVNPSPWSVQSRTTCSAIFDLLVRLDKTMSRSLAWISRRYDCHGNMTIYFASAMQNPISTASMNQFRYIFLWIFDHRIPDTATSTMLGVDKYRVVQLYRLIECPSPRFAAEDDLNFNSSWIYWYISRQSQTCLTVISCNSQQLNSVADAGTNM